MLRPTNEHMMKFVGGNFFESVTGIWRHRYLASCFEGNRSGQRSLFESSLYVDRECNKTLSLGSLTSTKFVFRSVTSAVINHSRSLSRSVCTLPTVDHKRQLSLSYLLSSSSFKPAINMRLHVKPTDRFWKDLICTSSKHSELLYLPCIGTGSLRYSDDHHELDRYRIICTQVGLQERMPDSSSERKIFRLHGEGYESVPGKPDNYILFNLELPLDQPWAIKKEVKESPNSKTKSFVLTMDFPFNQNGRKLRSVHLRLPLFNTHDNVLGLLFDQAAEFVQNSSGTCTL